MGQYIAYPEDILKKNIVDDHYKSLQVTDKSFFKNELAMSKFDSVRSLKLLREKFDPTHWTQVWQSRHLFFFCERNNFSHKFCPAAWRCGFGQCLLLKQHQQHQVPCRNPTRSVLLQQGAQLLELWCHRRSHRTWNYAWLWWQGKEEGLWR